jgi:cytochrome c oxidase subunit 2
MRLELAWTIAPALLLLGIAVPTLASIIHLGRDAKADALHVTVTASRFAWNFEYTDPEFVDAHGNALTTNELHIPVDREIAVELEAQDVIHSFWVPKLAGKLDVVPGRNNRMWFNATAPGVYAGQCAEFCGIGHSIMKFTVVAEEQAGFQAWVDEQLAAE